MIFGQLVDMVVSGSFRLRIILPNNEKVNLHMTQRSTQVKDMLYEYFGNSYSQIRKLYVEKLQIVAVNDERRNLINVKLTTDDCKLLPENFYVTCDNVIYVNNEGILSDWGEDKEIKHVKVSFTDKLNSHEPYIQVGYLRSELWKEPRSEKPYIDVPDKFKDEEIDDITASEYAQRYKVKQSCAELIVELREKIKSGTDVISDYGKLRTGGTDYWSSVSLTDQMYNGYTYQQFYQLLNQLAPFGTNTKAAMRWYLRGLPLYAVLLNRWCNVIDTQKETSD